MSDVKAVTDTSMQIKTPSMWKVMLHNDDYTPMEFVTSVLVYIFHKSSAEAEAIMLAVHNSGKANVGLFTKDVAVTKVAQVMRAAEEYGHPLLATAEEA